MPKKTMLGVILPTLIFLVMSVATAVPITFNTFNGSFPYVENGFNVTPSQTPTGGSWTGGAGGLGTTAPQNPYVLSQQGTLQINAVNGGLFYFNSVDLGGSAHEFVDYSITGSVNGKSLFSDNGALNTFNVGNPLNLITGNPSLMIDSLFITLYSDPSVNVYYSVANIDVNAVPDVTSTGLLLGFSTGALVLFGRQWRSAARR